MGTLPGRLSEKLNIKLAIDSKKDISGGQKLNVSNCILTLNFIFSGQLGNLIISRNAFRSS